MSSDPLPDTHNTVSDALRASEAERAAILDAALDGIIVMNAEGLVTEWNPAAARLFGYSRDQAVGQVLSELIIPVPMREAHKIGLAHYLATGHGPLLNRRIEVVGLRADQTLLPVELAISPLHVPNRTLFIAYVRDISERHQAERALRESEERYRSLVDATSQIVWTNTAQGEMRGAQPGWSSLTGQSEVEYTGYGWAQAVHPDDAQPTIEAWQRAVTDCTPFVFEHRVRVPNGSYRLFAIRAVPVLEADGSIREWVGIHTDITERRQAELAQEALYWREATLNRISDALRSTSDPDEVRAAAVQALGEALGVDRAYYTVYDLARDGMWIGDDFRRADLPSLAGEYRNSDFAVTPQTIYPSDETFLTSDVLLERWPEPFVEALAMLRVRAVISVPLRTEGILVGALTVAMADAPRAWTASEVALVETVAGQTRTAQEAARVQQRERRIASVLQDALQPAPPAHVPGLDIADYTKPALAEASIGGDFYDVFAVDAARYALVIGDVSGKGLTAAAQVAAVRNMLRFALYGPATLTVAVTELNRVLTQNDLLTGFVTLFVGLYDAGARTLRFISCGHEPGLLRRANGGAVELLPPTGPPLGIDPQASFMEQCVTLETGDQWMLYTDGLSEEGPSRREMLGVAGVSQIFSSAADTPDAYRQMRQIVQQVQVRAGGVLRDDVCVLLVRVTSEQGEQA